MERSLHIVMLELLLPLLLCCGKGDISSGDSDALIDFKRSITRDPNGILIGWSEHVPCCNWTGVTCHPKHPGRVWQLDLHNQSLSGTLSPSLGMLQRLSHLNLSSNDLTGTIPAEIGNCPFLKALLLNSNAFQGNIPASIGNCSRLEALQINANRLSGPIPDMFLRLQHLRSLSLSTNNLQGGIPSSIFNCSRLEYLSLSDNALNGTIPDSFQSQQQLAVLDLGMNNLYGRIPPSLGRCQKLEFLVLRVNLLSGELPLALPLRLQYFSAWGNQLQGQIPLAVANLSDLEILRLNSNNFTGRIPLTLGSGQLKLRDVRLCANALFGSIPHSLTNCSSLHYLDLSNNLLTGPIPKSIGELWNLTNFYLTSNHLTGSIPDSIGNLSAVIELALAGNLLSGRIPASLGSLTRVQRLSLAANNLSGSIPAALIKGCQNLGLLLLRANRLEGHIPQELGQMQSLSFLSLRNNLLTGPIPSSIGNLNRLQNLNLGRNMLSGTLPESLQNLGNSLLLQFDVSYNQLTGVIPPWIGNFDKVQDISLAFNKFSGRIPSTINKCKGLLSLNLASNSLSGPIPIDLIQLYSLTTLDLSVNNLTGPIPASLANLTDINFLNVSWNNLEGPIPTQGLFSRLNYSSFMGNPLLCGKLVNKSCPLNEHNKKNVTNRVLKWVIPLVVIASIGGFTAAAIVFVFFRRPAFKARGGPLKLFSPKQLSSVTNGFDNSNIIGEGGCSRVFKGTWDGITVAIKVMKQPKDVVRKNFLAEAEIMAKLRHRNIVRVLGYCCSDQILALVMEYMPNGSLSNYLATTTLASSSKLDIALDIVQGLHYMHYQFDQPVIHCDLKPGNILLDPDLTAHLSDFGISKLVLGNDNTVTVSNFRGTIGYAPPGMYNTYDPVQPIAERLIFAEYAHLAAVSTVGDVYSYGMVLLSMMTGKSPTDKMFHETESCLRDWVLDDFTAETNLDRIDKLLLQVGLLCTASNPRSRPTIKEVLAMLMEVKEGHRIITMPSWDALVSAHTADESWDALVSAHTADES